MAKKREEAPAGVPEWVVTYGDLMSLLLCFFILLAAFSELKKPRDYEATVQSIQQAFGYQGGTGFNSSALPASTMSEVIQMAINGRLMQFADRAEIEVTPGRFMRVTTIDEGVMFTLGGAMAFEAGSYELTPEMKETLDGVANELRGRRQRIVIRGHAWGVDNINPEKLDLLDLSYRRARAVGEYLVTAGGVMPRAVSYEARGDTDPEAVRLYGAQEQRVNRRVEIILTEATVDETAPGANFTGQ